MSLSPSAGRRGGRSRSLSPSRGRGDRRSGGHSLSPRGGRRRGRRDSLELADDRRSSRRGGGGRDEDDMRYYIKKIYEEFSNLYEMIKGETKLIRKHSSMERVSGQVSDMDKGDARLARHLKERSPLDMLKSLYEETNEVQKKLNKNYRHAFFRKVDQQVRFLDDDRRRDRDERDSRYDRHSRRDRSDRGSSKRDNRDRRDDRHRDDRRDRDRDDRRSRRR